MKQPQSTSQWLSLEWSHLRPQNWYKTTLHRTTNGIKRKYSQAAFLSIWWRAHAVNASIFILRWKFDPQQLFDTKFSGFLLFLCLVHEDPKAPCYRKHVCVRNSGFSRIVSPTTRDNFRAMFVWFLYPEETWRIDGNFFISLGTCSQRLPIFLCSSRSHTAR